MKKQEDWIFGQLQLRKFWEDTQLISLWGTDEVGEI